MTHGSRITYLSRVSASNRHLGTVVICEKAFAGIRHVWRARICRGLLFLSEFDSHSLQLVENIWRGASREVAEEIIAETVGNLLSNGWTLSGGRVDYMFLKKVGGL
jgi:hypothetical protein